MNMEVFVGNVSHNLCPSQHTKIPEIMIATIIHIITYLVSSTRLSSTTHHQIPAHYSMSILYIRHRPSPRQSSHMDSSDNQRNYDINFSQLTRKVM